MAKNKTQTEEPSEVAATAELETPAKREPSFPPGVDHKDKKLAAQAQQLRAKWKEQKRDKCRTHPCYYPLNLKKDEDNQPILIKTSEGPAYAAECSWDPEMHLLPDGSQQYVTLESIKEREEEQK